MHPAFSVPKFPIGAPLVIIKKSDRPLRICRPAVHMTPSITNDNWVIRKRVPWCHEKHVVLAEAANMRDNF